MYGGNIYNRYYSNPQDLLVVDGKNSAYDYNMPPNSRVVLMDRNLPRFYLKETDASGHATVRAYDFTEVKEESVEYITRAEFEQWKEKYESNLKATDSTIPQF